MFKKAKPLKNPEDAEHGYNYALFLLNLRQRSEGEVRKKMLDRGYVKKVIDETITKLLADKYLNDEYYAEMFLENMKRFKYYGQFIVRRKMAEKFLPRELIETAMAEFFSEEDERDIAKRYVLKEFGPLKEVRKMEYDEKQKVMRRLLSRGFGLEMVRDLVQ